MTDNIAYIRTSTGKQNIGLDAQRTTIDRFISDNGGELAGVYIEQASGGRDSRPELSKAMNAYKKDNHTLLVAKLDRVSRRMSFIATLLESNIPFKVAEMPQADTFQLHIYAALAAKERELISTRTREALQERKRQGVQLGVNGKKLAKENSQKAKEFANGVRTIVEEIRLEGFSSY